MHRNRVRGVLGALVLSALGASGCGSSENGGLFGPPGQWDAGGTDVTTDPIGTDEQSSEPTGTDTDETTEPGMSADPDGGATTDTTEPTETTEPAAPSTDATDTTDTPTWVDHCAIAFGNLEDGRALKALDDEQGSCADGIQYRVELEVDAPDGEIVKLKVDGKPSVQGAVRDGRVSIEVTLDPQASSTLTASLAEVPTCEQTIEVSGACVDPVQCDISYPIKSVLNGRPSPDGDRVGGEHLPFRTRVEVATNAADGNLVLLSIGGGVGLAGITADGRAVFPAVELPEDGVHQLIAECHSDGASAESDPRTVLVDTLAPEVPVAAISPSDGVHFSPESDLDPETPVLDFDVCVPVHSEDALDLAGAGAQNIHVALGTQAPRTGAATSGGLGSDDGGCVRLQCPGRAQFNLNVSVFDQAGNVFHHTISGLTCASSLPTVGIVSLRDASGDGLEADPQEYMSRRLLAATAPEGQLKDEDPETSGAQHTLVACTDAPSGSARLLAGLAGEDLSERATSAQFTAAQSSDGCPSSLGYVIRFPGATLPQSAISGNAVRLTEMIVEVTDELGETNRSEPVRLWVDTVAPTGRVYALGWPGAPAGLPKDYSCGDVILTKEPIAVDVSFQSSGFSENIPLHVWLEGDAAASTEVTSAATLVPFDFELGIATLQGETTDPAGNTTQLPECSFTVGDPPLVAWVTPNSSVRILNGADAPPSPNALPDADDSAPGWQGGLEVTVRNLEEHEMEEGTVQFFANDTPVGDPIDLASAPELEPPSEDAYGVMKYSRVVTLDLESAGLHIPEHSALTLRAEVAGADDSAQSSLRNLLVDVTAPDEPKEVLAQLGPNPGDRRQTRFQLSWEAPSDGGTGPVADYAIAYATAQITDLSAFAAAAPVDFTGTPAAPGDQEAVMVSDLTIETVYHFAVRAVDAAGNFSELVQASAEGEDSPGLAARFKTLVLHPPDDRETARFGHQMDGSTDLTGDGLADLLVSSLGSGEVYLFKGEPEGFSPEPLITFRSDPTHQFGYSIAVVGDINGDQAGTSAADVAHSQDIVLIEHRASAQRAYVIFGRDWEDANTPSVFDMTAGDYDAVINLAPSGGGTGSFEFAQFAFAARLGDFNSDGIDDFAVGVPFSSRVSNDFVGVVAVVLGSSEFSSFTLADTSSFGSHVWAIWGNGVGRETRPIVGLPPMGGLSGSSLLTSNANGTGVNPPTVFLLNNPTLGEQMTVDDAREAWDGPSNWANSQGGAAGYFGYGLLSGPGIAVPSPNAQAAAGQDGVVDVFFASSGELFGAGATVRLYDSTATSPANDNFGRVAVGNAFSGRTSGYATSFIGDALNQSGNRDPDLVLGAAHVIADDDASSKVAPTLYFIAGSTLRQLSGTVDLATTPDAYDVRYELGQLGVEAQGWRDSEAVAIRDMDGDGYGDIAISESSQDLSAEVNFPGRVIVLY